jgi:hypothetical protein
MSDVESSLRGVVVDGVSKRFRLESIKSRIIGLALLATLVPSLAMAWISYAQNRAALAEKVSEELRSVSTQTARELDLWFKERLFDVQVFASSFQVSENIERTRRPSEAARAVTRLNDYLASVGDRFSDYDELLVVDGTGELLASSVEQAGEVHLPAGWLDRVASGKVVIADAYWDEELGRPLMTVAVPINGADRTFLGALVTNVSYRPVLTDAVHLGRLLWERADAIGDAAIVEDTSELLALAADAATDLARVEEAGRVMANREAAGTVYDGMGGGATSVVKGTGALEAIEASRQRLHDLLFDAVRAMGGANRRLPEARGQGTDLARLADAIETSRVALAEAVTEVEQLLA